MPRAVNPYSPMESTEVTPTLDPRFSGLYDQLLAGIGNIPQFNFQDYLQQAFGGPQFQSAARGIMGALQPQFAQQQRGLQDQFRMAGMMPSTAFAQGMSNLMGQQGLQRNQLLSELSTNMLGTSLQAGRLGLESALAPITAQTNLLRSLPAGQTSTENVNMGNMLQLLQALRGATGGGGTGPVQSPWGWMNEAMRGGQGGGARGPSNPGYDQWGNPTGPSRGWESGGGMWGGGLESALGGYGDVGGYSNWSSPFDFTGGEANYSYDPWSDPYDGDWSSMNI